MRRRHLKGVMSIERRVYPRPWSPNLFLSEMSELSNRAYIVARLDREVVGYGGLICYGDEAHVATLGVTKALQGLVKQRRDSVEQYEKAGRAELAQKESAEIVVIEEYLPQAASAESRYGDCMNRSGIRWRPRFAIAAARWTHIAMRGARSATSRSRFSSTGVPASRASRAAGRFR